MKPVIKRTLVFLFVLLFINNSVYGDSLEEVEENVVIGLSLRGTGSQSGTMTYVMTRIYGNTTDKSQNFRDVVSFPYETFQSGLVDITFVSEQLSVERTKNNIYIVSGNLEPSERQEITFVYSQETMLELSSSEYFSQHFNLFKKEENLKLGFLNIYFSFPPGVSQFENNELALIDFDKKGEDRNFQVEPKVSKDPSYVSWLVTDDNLNEKNKDMKTKKYDLDDIDMVNARFEYTIRLNPLPNYLTYVFMGISIMALILSFITYKRIKNTKVD